MSIIVGLLKLLAWLFAFVFFSVMLIVGVGEWSDGNRHIADRECNMRRMDAKIAQNDTGLYHDICMQAKGYKRLSFCITTTTISAPEFCFAPNWQFWRK